jgi:AmmeMemoRadiSam system protein B
MKPDSNRKSYWKFIGPAIFAAVLILAYTDVISEKSDPKIIDGDNGNIPTIGLYKTFYERDNFQKAIKTAEEAPLQRGIKGVFVTHHLLASEITAQQLKRAQSNRITKIFIIGPNHNEIGNNFVATTNASWITPLGTMRAEISMVNKLVSEMGTSNNVSVFNEEHAFGAIVPFAKYYFPNATIIPIAYSLHTPQYRVDKIGEWLANNSDEKTLVVFSVDFSHYLPRNEADKMDSITRDLIEKRDIKTIMLLNNNYVDSPASLSTALIYANRKNLSVNILGINNSDDFSAIPNLQTTSYFAITIK